MKFDEINSLRLLKKMYEELLKLNEEAFLDIANDIYKEEIPESEKRLNKKWLAVLLLGYDSVTQYVYEHEAERKQARLYEALMSTKGKTKNRDFTVAFNHWWKQTSQYAINVADSSAITAYADMGFKKVKWNAQIDDRTCGICKERNGKVYSINNLPIKHYHCRCYFTPVLESGDKNG